MADEIDIGLSILGPNSEQVLKSLVQQLEAVNKSMDMLKSQTVQEYADLGNKLVSQITKATTAMGEETSRFYKQIVQETKQMNQAMMSGMASERASVAQEGTRAPEGGGASVARVAAVQELVDWHGRPFEKPTTEMPIVSSQAATRRALGAAARSTIPTGADSDLIDRADMESAGGGVGYDGGSTARAPAFDKNAPEWLKEASGPATGALRIPRFKSFNAQDILNQLSRSLGRGPVTRYQNALDDFAGMSEENQRAALDQYGTPGGYANAQIGELDQLRGRAGAFVNRMSNAVPYVMSTSDALGLDSLAKTVFHPFDTQREGQRLGLGGSSQGFFPGPNDLMGAYTSAAGQEGLHQQLLMTELTRGSLNRLFTHQMGEEYKGALNNAGLGGTKGGPFEQISREVAAQIDKGRAMPSPGVTTELVDMQGRFGQMSWKQAVDNVASLGQAATRAKMNLDEYGMAVEQFYAANSGALTPGQAVTQSRNFSESTGFGPQLLTSLLSSPMVQSSVMLGTGVLPQAQAQLPGSVILGSAAQRVQMLANIFKSNPLFNQNTTKQTPFGSYKQSGSDETAALIANATHLDIQTVKQLLNPAFVKGQGALGAFEYNFQMTDKQRHQNVKDIRFIDKHNRVAGLDRATMARANADIDAGKYHEAKMAINKYIKSKGQGLPGDPSSVKDANTIYIELRGKAKNMFKIAEGKAKDAVTAGSASSTSSIRTPKAQNNTDSVWGDVQSYINKGSQ